MEIGARITGGGRRCGCRSLFSLGRSIYRRFERIRDSRGSSREIAKVREGIAATRPLRRSMSQRDGRLFAGQAKLSYVESNVPRIWNNVIVPRFQHRRGERIWREAVLRSGLLWGGWRGCRGYWRIMSLKNSAGQFFQRGPPMAKRPPSKRERRS